MAQLRMGCADGPYPADCGRYSSRFTNRGRGRCLRDPRSPARSVGLSDSPPSQQVFIALTVLFSDLGVTPSLIRLPEVTDDKLSTAFWLGVGLGIGMCGIMETVAGPAAAWLHEPRLALTLRVVALTIPVTQLCQVPMAIFRVGSRCGRLARRQIASISVATGGALIMAFLGFGVWSLVFQDCGTVALEAVILWRAVSWRPTLDFSRREASGLAEVRSPGHGNAARQSRTRSRRTASHRPAPRS